MSYSFTDNGEGEDEEDEEVDILHRTSMVPVIDLLNHHYEHHAELNYEHNQLTLVAVRDIKKVCAVQCMVHTCIINTDQTSMHTHAFSTVV